MNRSASSRLLISLVWLVGVAASCGANVSSSANCDPFPVYSPIYPNLFLHTKEREQIKHIRFDKKKDYFRFSISPFIQKATTGTDWKGRETITYTAGTTTETVDVGLPNLGGNWGMIGLLVGDAPAGKTLPNSLTTAEAIIFGGFPDKSLAIDPKECFGFFSTQTNYRRAGVRAELEVRLINGFGLGIKAGAADINHRRETLVNRTGYVVETWKNALSAAIPTCTETNVNAALMEPYKLIFSQLGYTDLESFSGAYPEDTHISLFCRHAIEINRTENPAEWGEFLLIPFATIDVTIATGKQKDSSSLMGIPFGNNGHHAVGGTVGLNFDFFDSMELGFELGGNYFLERSKSDFRVPTSKWQSQLYPYTTDVKVKPGPNWHFGAAIYAPKFSANFRFYAQYVFACHLRDNLSLDTPDTAFNDEAIEAWRDRTRWSSHLANFGLSYDISPNINLGLLWQWPIARTNAFTTSTFMLGATFNF